MTWKNTNVLVTGGTGFVGSHLVERLVKEGANVVTTYLTEEPKSYFSIRNLDKKVTLSRTNVSNFSELYDLVTKSNTQYVFHLAAQPLVEVAYYNPRETLEANIMGTVNVLECARLYSKLRGVIVASSDKAYGKLHGKQYNESSPLQGDHPYDVSKSAADLISSTYATTYKLPVVITRFGNIYGEGDLNLSRIIPGIMHAIISKQPLILRSNGKMVRDYLYVGDVIDGYLALTENIDKTKGQAFNFGSTETVNVLEVIQLAEKILEIKIPYHIQNVAKNEIPYQSLNYQKVQDQINWQPRYTFSKTLAKVLSYYQKVL